MRQEKLATVFVCTLLVRLTSKPIRLLKEMIEQRRILNCPDSMANARCAQ